MDEVYEYDQIDMDKFICKDEIDGVEWHAIMNEIEWHKWPYGSTWNGWYYW
jgi:hypothetical protein